MVCTQNPEELRQQLELTVGKRNGSVITIPAGPLVLRAGSNISFDLPDDSAEAQISAGIGVGSEQPYYRQKYNTLDTIAAVVNGPFPDPSTGITPPIPPGKTVWQFSPASLWIATAELVAPNPLTGNYFIGGDACIGPGEFEETDYRYPNAAAELKLVDICAPCVDCQTWDRINTYLIRIQAFYDYMYALINDPNTDDFPEHPDGGVRVDFTGVYQQLMACLRYWDYLVHRSTVKLAAQSTGQALVVAAFYRNISDAEVGTGTGIDFVFTFAFKMKVGADWCPWSGLTATFVAVRALDRPDRNSAWETDTQFISGGEIPPCTAILTGAHTIQVTMHCDALPSGDECYADLALVFKNLDKFTESGEYRADVAVTVSPVHLTPPGTETKTTEVFFLPPKPESSSSS